MNDLEQELVDQVIKEHAELTRQRDILAAAIRKSMAKENDKIEMLYVLKNALREAGMEPPEAGNLDPDNVWQEEKEDEP